MGNIFAGGYVDPKNSMDTDLIPTVQAVTANHIRHMPVHMKDYPLSEKDARVAQSQYMVSNLRASYDALVSQSASKRQQIKEMSDAIRERRQQDAFTEACIASGKLIRRITPITFQCSSIAMFTNF